MFFSSVRKAVYLNWNQQNGPAAIESRDAITIVLKARFAVTVAHAYFDGAITLLARNTASWERVTAPLPIFRTDRVIVCAGLDAMEQSAPQSLDGGIEESFCPTPVRKYRENLVWVFQQSTPKHVILPCRAQQSLIVVASLCLSRLIDCSLSSATDAEHVSKGCISFESKCREESGRNPDKPVDSMTKTT